MGISLNPTILREIILAATKTPNLYINDILRLVLERKIKTKDDKELYDAISKHSKA